MEQQLAMRLGDFIYWPSLILGKGEYSVVYRGKSLKGEFPVAVKHIVYGINHLERLVHLFRREIKILKETAHNGIVRLLASYQFSGEIFMVMQHFEGESLLRQIRTRGPLSNDLALQLGLQISQALLYLSLKNILHRDVKTENILVSGNRTLLIDLGFANYLRYGAETMMVQNLGTPFYMSPQLLLRTTYTSKTDVWSFGVLLYEMLHGKTPWPSRTNQELLFRINREPVSISGTVWPSLSKIILACLKYNEQERPDFASLHSAFLRVKSEEASKRHFQVSPARSSLNQEVQKQSSNLSRSTTDCISNNQQPNQQTKFIILPRAHSTIDVTLNAAQPILVRPLFPEAAAHIGSLVRIQNKNLVSQLSVV